MSLPAAIEYVPIGMTQPNGPAAGQCPLAQYARPTAAIPTRPATARQGPQYATGRRGAEIAARGARTDSP